MVYDASLTDRMRRALKHVNGVVEKRMMGGICFMVDNHMVGGAHQEKTGQQRFMFRVGKPNIELALMNQDAHPVEMGGRLMGGFIYVDGNVCSDKELGRWMDLCVAFTRTLPPKVNKEK